jgi:hypothetical protein
VGGDTVKEELRRMADEVANNLMICHKNGNYLSKSKCLQLAESLTDKNAEIAALKASRLNIARVYDPNCEEWHEEEQIEVMRAAAGWGNALQELAEGLGDDPEGELTGCVDKALGEIAALREREGELTADAHRERQRAEAAERVARVAQADAECLRQTLEQAQSLAKAAQDAVGELGLSMQMRDRELNEKDSQLATLKEWICNGSYCPYCGREYMESAAEHCQCSGIAQHGMPPCGSCEHLNSDGVCPHCHERPPLRRHPSTGMAAENERMREALEFYGNAHNYMGREDDHGIVIASPIDCDEGAKARAALAQEGEG